MRAADFRQIVWLASYPKSGNTWVRMLIDAYYLGEVDINDILCSVSDDTSTRYNIGDKTDIRDYPIEMQQLARPMAMLRMVNQYRQNKIEGMPLFVKSHTLHMLVNGIEMLPEILTKAVIHLVRDPRDVMPSFAEHMGLDHEKALHKMEDDYNCLTSSTKFAKVGDFTGSWLSHTRSFVYADTHNVKTFKYEDLKADPVRVFTEMLLHAGVEPDMERVKKAVELCELSRLKKQEQDKGFKESSPHAKDQFFGKKHKQLSINHRYRIEKRNARLLKKLGYASKKAA